MLTNTDERKAYLSNLNLNDLRKSLTDGYAKLMSIRGEASTERERLKNLAFQKDMQKSRLLLSETIDGKNAEIRNAQMAEKLRDVDEKIRKQEMAVSKKETAYQIAQDNTSMLRNIARITVAELNFLSE